MMDYLQWVDYRDLPSNEEIAIIAERAGRCLAGDHEWESYEIDGLQLERCICGAAREKL